MSNQAKIEQLKSAKEELEHKLQNPQDLTDSNRSLLYSDLEYYTNAFNILSRIEKISKELESTEMLLNDPQTDSEMAEIAKDELESLAEQLESAKKDYNSIEIDRKYSDPDDLKSVIIEIRAGAGGDEAGLFAGDIFRMYQHFADKMGWQIEIISSSINESGGYKEIIFSIQGKNVYKWLKYESGVHRVQRIPTTEAKGRIHTSTVSVAILPEAKEIDIKINPEDIRVDTMRASGAGGQCVNRTDSAIRITHFESGIVVSCQETKHQAQNREKAMAMLRARLYEKKKREEDEKRDQMRSSQIGKMMRAEKIRTYNFPQNRITDHRVKLSWHNLENILNGDLELMLNETNQEVLNLLIEEDAKQTSTNSTVL